MFSKEDALQLKKTFTEELKSVRSIEELKSLLERVYNADTHIELIGKRRHYSAYAFEQHKYNENKVVYLYDDSISTGKSEYKNLYKVLEFRVWYSGGVV